MRAFLKIKYLLLVLPAVIYFSSCEKPASEEEYGFPLIYMPQAAMDNGGLNNNYAVPGSNSRYPNYIFDSIGGKLDIILGVYRAGLQKLEDYSVEVYARVDTTNRLVNDSILKNWVMLPDDVYSFPTSVSVTDGKRESIFYLSVNIAKLNSSYVTLYGKKLTLAVGIRNPTKYDLNKSLSTTVLLINSGKFMKKP